MPRARIRSAGMGTASVARRSLGAAVRRVLEDNTRAGRTPGGVGYRYTCPDGAKYPDQFLWDSCLIALAWSRIDVARARDELRTLAAAQAPDGHIGHTVFWGGPVRLRRLAGYNVATRRAAATSTIQPPLLGWAWAQVADRSRRDEGFRAEGRRVVAAHHRWLTAHRADDEGLLRILQPDESGLDATPAYDRALGRRAHPRPGFVLLVHANRRRGFDLRRAEAAGAFTATDVLVNTAWALSWHGLARLGEPGAAAEAHRVTRALERRLWTPEAGIFHARGPGGAVHRVDTWAGLAPLALPDLHPEIADTVITRHLLDPSRFWLPYPVPSVSAAEPSFRPGDTGRPIRRYWRGPTWPFTWWFVHRGLVLHGRHREACALAGRARALVGREGLREYYNPISGRGLGGRAFAVSGIVLDLDAGG